MLENSSSFLYGKKEGNKKHRSKNMSAKRYVGIVVIVLGVFLIVSSFIIKSRVAEGRRDIHSAQQTLDQGSRLFSSSPVGKEVGKGVTRGVQSKIDEGRAKADHYASMAFWFQIGGAVFVLLGSGLVVFGKKN